MIKNGLHNNIAHALKKMSASLSIAISFNAFSLVFSMALLCALGFT